MKPYEWEIKSDCSLISLSQNMPQEQGELIVALLR